MPSHMYLIVTSQANDSQRNAVQAIVKEHANGWWHQLPDICIVGGHDHVYWRDLIKPVLLLSNASVIVFQLPDEKKHRMWAAAGVELTK
jgi:hypothetical protein